VGQPSVNTSVQSAEQQNQVQGEQYAQQQQAAAQKQLAQFLKQNPSAVSTAAPIQAPAPQVAGSNGTIGGGSFMGGAATPAPGQNAQPAAAGAAQPGAAAANPAAAPAGGVQQPGQISPAMRQKILQLMTQQKAM